MMVTQGLAWFERGVGDEVTKVIGISLAAKEKDLDFRLPQITVNANVTLACYLSKLLKS